MIAPATPGYSLEIEHPETGTTTIEGFLSLSAVIARAAGLIEAGYNVGIWAAVPSRNLDPANDDGNA